jgi:heme oxygenase
LTNADEPLGRDHAEFGGEPPTIPGASTAEALRTCPAFSSGSCPFKGAHSAEQVQETFMRIPSSHFSKNSEFLHVLHGLHEVKRMLSAAATRTTVESEPTAGASHQEGGGGGSSNISEFRVPGGCPVQRMLWKDEEAAVPTSFAEAMEEFSLSSIMASLAQRQIDDERHQERQERTEPESHHHQQPAALFKDDNRDDSESAADGVVAAVEAAALETVSSAASSVHEAANDTATVTAKRTTTLSSALKAGTAESHKAAESVHFVSNFVRGKIDRTLYGQLVAMLYHVYEALEECLDRHGPHHFGSCHFPAELGRVEALREDVEFWHGLKGGRDNGSALLRVPEPTRATLEYVERIRHVAETNPLLLLSHAYTRYLGDLSGGKVLARVARRALDLSRDGDGLAFYEFENVDSPKLFKDRYRAALDALPLTEAEIEDLVGEANVAFVLNMRLFEELDVQARVTGATVRPLSEALACAARRSSAVSGRDRHAPAAGAVSDKCPFLVRPPSSGGGVTAAPAPSKQCPWPFILLHDPATGVRDAKTWAVLGLLLCWVWSIAITPRG